VIADNVGDNVGDVRISISFWMIPLTESRNCSQCPTHPESQEFPTSNHPTFTFLPLMHNWTLNPQTKVAGMGADLFESYVGSMIACATLAGHNPNLIALPFILSSAGIFCSMIGTLKID
jgi:hypothetical protein